MIENLNHKTQKLSQLISLKLGQYFHSVLSSGQQLTEKAKIQIEVKKLKRELKTKYQDLGKYVTQKKDTKSVIDFSHDSEYLKKINEIIKLKFYIEKRTK